MEYCKKSRAESKIFAFLNLYALHSLIKQDKKWPTSGVKQNKTPVKKQTASFLSAWMLYPDWSNKRWPCFISIPTRATAASSWWHRLKRYSPGELEEQSKGKLSCSKNLQAIMHNVFQCTGLQQWAHLQQPFMAMQTWWQLSFFSSQAIYKYPTAWNWVGASLHAWFWNSHV